MDEELSVSVIGTVAAGVVAVACVELLRRRWATKQDVVGTAAPAGAAGPPDKPRRSGVGRAVLPPRRVGPRLLL